MITADVFLIYKTEIELWSLLDEFTLLFFCKSCYGYTLRCCAMLLKNVCRIIRSLLKVLEKFDDE